MKYPSYLLISTIVMFLFAACSTKEYFEAHNSQNNFAIKKNDLNSSIISINKDGATLKDKSVITKNGLSKIKLQTGFKFLNINDNMIISSNYKDKVMLNDRVIKVNGVAIAASIKSNLLALLFSNNSIELYDLEKNKTVLKEYFTHSFVNDTRIANPYFMGKIILFPTLNGRIVIVSALNKKIIKNIVVDVDGQFNNIIFLDVIKDTLVAATSNKVITVGDGLLNLKTYHIRDIITKDDNIYLASIDGQIIKTDISLNIISRKKYKFAKFYALAFGTSLYALESQGYLINISNDFKKDKIYDFSFDNSKKVISIGNKIYYDNKYLTLP